MSTFAGMPLLSEDHTLGGALFYIRRAPDRPLKQPLDDGVEVDLAAGSRGVLVHGVRATTHDEVLELALDAVERALDLLSARGEVQARTTDLDEQRLVWWTEGSGPRIRLWAISPMSFTFRAELRVDSPDGSPRPDPPPPSNWHPSMRFFRLSQVTDDLSDAFRNLYLALESILSQIKPKGSEAEDRWFREALLASSVDLTGFAEAADQGAAAELLVQSIYRDVRTAVFHAKVDRPVHLPFDSGSREQVARAVGEVGALYRSILGSSMGVRFVGSGGLSPFGFRTMVDALGLRLHLTQDETPFDPAETFLPTGPRTSLSLVRAEDLDESDLIAFRAESPISEISKSISFLGKALTTGSDDGSPELVVPLEGRLDLRGFDMFEAVVGPRLVPGSPRTRYAK